MNYNYYEVIIIYIDVYFFLNFAVDFLSLFSVQKLLFLPECKKRCLLGGLLGSAWSVLTFLYPIMGLLNIPILFALVFIVTYKKDLAHHLLGMLIFIFAEIFIGGCITAMKNIFGGIERQSLIYAGAIMLIAFLGIELYSLMQMLARRRLKSPSIRAEIKHRNRKAKLLLLIDSGNLVKEKTTMRHVLFIKSSSIEDVVGDCSTVFEREKCYVIPIETAMGKSSVLGFIPDDIQFSDKKYNKEKFMVVPDICGGEFAGYDGIAPML